MNQLETLLNEYLDYLIVEKGRSLKTRQNYERYLRHFLSHSKARAPTHITPEAVRQFRLRLAQKQLKKNTQQYYAIALRNFLKYLLKRGIKALPPDAIELGKISARDLDLINPEELARLLEAPLQTNNLKLKTQNQPTETLRKLRDKAILETLFSTGLRISELCRLTRDTINLKTGEFAVRGKGEKIRLVFLSDRARETISAYLTKRVDVDEALFISVPKTKNVLAHNYTAITPRQIQRLIKYYAVKAGLSKKITPHTLRHLFATDLLRNGASIRAVQAMLGHSSLATTQIYTHFADPELKEIHKKYHNK